MNVKFTGKIIAAGQVQMGTSQNGTQWSSQEYVIEELNEQYPSRAVIQVYGSDKIQQFGIQVGEIITANIGLKAHQPRDTFTGHVSNSNSAFGMPSNMQE